MPSFLSPFSNPPPSPPRASSYSPSRASHLRLQSLPYALLSLIAEHLKPVDSIKGMQLANWWALDLFSYETKKVVLWSMPLLEEKAKEQEKEMSLSEWVVQRATTFWAFLSRAAAANMAEKQRKGRLLKHSIVLGYFLTRFPNLTTIQADVGDKELANVLVEVFKRKTFPTVERFEDVAPIDRGVVFGHMPFSILAGALPNLHVLGFSADGPVLDLTGTLQISIFSRAFGKGMFPKVQEIGVRYRVGTQQHLSGQGIVDLLATALEARESLGGFPYLTRLSFADAGFSLRAFERILSLDSCSKLRSLQCTHVHWTHALRVQEVVASYMRRTQCRWLESVSIPPILGGAHGAGGLGPIGDVIRDGLATNLRRIEGLGSGFGEAAYEQLSDVIYAGSLPNLEELHFATLTTHIIALERIGVLNHYISGLQLGDAPGMSSLVLLHLLLDGAFPYIKELDICHYDEQTLKTFISMLRSGGVQGAHTLRRVAIAGDISLGRQLQLRELLPAAEVRRDLV